MHVDSNFGGDKRKLQGSTLPIEGIDPVRVAPSISKEDTGNGFEDTEVWAEKALELLRVVVVLVIAKDSSARCHWCQLDSFL